MERHEILEAMSELKLYGMRASFDEIAGKGLARRDEIYPLIASLIRAERTHRQARSISYRIGGAKFPVLKDIDTFTFADTPIDEGQVRELATGTFRTTMENRGAVLDIGGPVTRPAANHRAIATTSAARPPAAYLIPDRKRPVRRSGDRGVSMRACSCPNTASSLAPRA